MLLLLGRIIVLQIVAVVIVLIILKKILDTILIDAAIRKIEALDPNRIDQSLKDVGVVTYKPLSETEQQRSLNAVFKKLKRTTRLCITRDKKIRGGVIITLHTLVIDYSLIGRLREGGIIRR